MKTTQIMTVSALAAFILTGCATRYIDQYGYGSLPVSDLSTNTDIIDGSSIAFQASSDSCNFVSVHSRPKLADGNFGMDTSFEFEKEPKKRGFKPKRMDGSGDVLNVMQLTPGEYAIDGLSCHTSGYPYFVWYTTPTGVPITYGMFTVYPGKTTYIGRISLELDADKKFQFTVEDDTKKAATSFKAMPEITTAFQVGVIAPFPNGVNSSTKEWGENHY